MNYNLLYCIFFLSSKLNDGKSSAYSEFCQVLDKEVESCLLSDLKVGSNSSNCIFCLCIFINSACLMLY
jgi:hypothetical protein